MKTKLSDIAEQIELGLSFALDKSEIPTYNSCYIDDELLWFVGHSDDEEYVIALPLDQEVEYKDGTLLATNDLGQSEEIRLFVATPMKFADHE
jgi:hypothetical protein